MNEVHADLLRSYDEDSMKAKKGKSCEKKTEENEVRESARECKLSIHEERQSF